MVLFFVFIAGVSVGVCIGMVVMGMLVATREEARLHHYR